MQGECLFKLTSFNIIIYYYYYYYYCMCFNARVSAQYCLFSIWKSSGFLFFLERTHLKTF